MEKITAWEVAAELKVEGSLAPGLEKAKREAEQASKFIQEALRKAVGPSNQFDMMVAQGATNKQLAGMWNLNDVAAAAKATYARESQFQAARLRAQDKVRAHLGIDTRAATTKDLAEANALTAANQKKINDESGKAARAWGQYATGLAYAARHALSSGPGGMAGGALGGLAGLALGGPWGAQLGLIAGSTAGSGLAQLAAGAGNRENVELGSPGLARQRELIERDRDAAAGSAYRETYRQSTDLDRYKRDFYASGGRTLGGMVSNFFEKVGNDISRAYYATLGRAEGIKVLPGAGAGLAPNGKLGQWFSSGDDVYKAVMTAALQSVDMKDWTKQAAKPTVFRPPMDVMDSIPFTEKDAAWTERGEGEVKGSLPPPTIAHYIDAAGRRKAFDVMAAPHPAPPGLARMGAFDTEPGGAKGGGGDMPTAVLKDIHALLKTRGQADERDAVIDDMIAVIR